MEQLCWKCCKATNSKLCPWVCDFEYPKGTKLDGENNIVFCPLFQPDERRKVRRQVKISRLFGISQRTYYRYKSQYNALYEKYKFVINLPKVDDLCEFFDENKHEIIENYELFLKKYLTIIGKSV